MNILILSFDYRPMLGGVATCAFEVAAGLSKIKGNSIHLLAPAMEGAEVFDNHGLFKTTRINLPKVAIKSIGSYGNAIRTICDENKFDAILSFLWIPDGLAVLKSGTNIPFFQMVHAVEVLESFSSLKKIVRAIFSPIKKRMFRQSRLSFAVSNYTKELVIKNCGVPAEKVKVVFNGVNPDLFEKRDKRVDLIEKYNLQNKFTFLTITRLEDYKGVDCTLKSIAKLKKKEKKADIAYLIGGVGPDRDRLETLVKELNLEKEVTFLGKVPSSDLVDFYNLSDCFVMLSRDDYKTPNVEGFGLVFLEAASCGVPSLAGRSGGIPDAVLDKKTGWLVNPTNIEEISNTMLNIIFDDQNREEMASYAHHRAIHEMNWENMANRIDKFMRDYVRD